MPINQNETGGDPISSTEDPNGYLDVILNMSINTLLFGIRFQEMVRAQGIIAQDVTELGGVVNCIPTPTRGDPDVANFRNTTRNTISRAAQNAPLHTTVDPKIDIDTYTTEVQTSIRTAIKKALGNPNPSPKTPLDKFKHYVCALIDMNEFLLNIMPDVFKNARYSIVDNLVFVPKYTYRCQFEDSRNRIDLMITEQVVTRTYDGLKERSLSDFKTIDYIMMYYSLLHAVGTPLYVDRFTYDNSINYFNPDEGI